MTGRFALLALLICLNLFLIYRLVWSDQGVFAYMELKNRYEHLESRIRAADAKGIDLTEEIKRLRSDRTYQEQVIREQMKYVKKDEILYIFPETSEENPGVASHE